MPEAKAKARRRRGTAIQNFRRWQRMHPNAKLDKQVKVFDMLVDGVPLSEITKRKNVRARI